MDFREKKSIIERYVKAWVPDKEFHSIFNLKYEIEDEVIIIYQTGTCCLEKSSIPIIKAEFNQLACCWYLYWFNLDHWVLYHCAPLNTLDEALRAVDEDDQSYFFG
ncbi:DUF3024 domain-containing protein [Limnobaculum zhutongyuii]|uniref:DUF3024 domain-containing protein n=1 Tax=Limnobaculum zhutongyuii TaxID=2498113 RepID=A0A411WGW5_9GAMM|nr:DUF3024 domain-containing protein [Limnobaculum zhutongyuii]QBH95541.1 DUF3024 domain-containing protein [Limnobaculum zhutongyuii]TQS88768.1 DUF3024 domain-containing protein [Limnobaculum zhutongyuii]